MRIFFKAILIFGFSLNLGLPVSGVEFFDINKPGIEKVKISLIANNEDEDIIDPLVAQLKNQLGKTLLFDVVDDPSKASYKLEINATNSSDTIAATLSGSQDSSFEAFTVGMKFRSEKPEYVSRKSAQLGNRIIKKLMGINGSLGSILVWSESKRGESRNSLYMGRLGIDKKTKLTYNLFNNTGASWGPKNENIIYSAQTGRGSEVLWQGFRPLRLKAKSIHYDQGKGSSASWGSNGKVYLAKYRGDKNTDIYEYNIVFGGKERKPSLEMSRRLTKHSAIETEPVLSPDGKKLAYISDRTGRPQVYLMNLSTKKMSRLSKKGSYNTSPAWSPDSSMVAFTSSRKGSRTAIYRVRVDSSLSSERQVSPKGMAAESPTWSPDGSMVAFQGWHRGDWKIFYVLSSGSSAERLTNSKQGIVETGPAWSSKLR
tara:strand:+ start:894 stop:2177 length:1284 start_codon:yes stop_codon:yes gene_type:complete